MSDLLVMTTNLTYLPPDVARVGRLLGGPPGLIYGRLYAPDGELWPRVRIGVYREAGEVILKAFAKASDSWEEGWVRIEVPHGLEDVARAIMEEAVCLAMN